jgi:DNA-binding FadR family transcriptional regulator
MRTAEEALAGLRGALEAGEFPPGARLPPERALARRLEVGRGTLRKALDALAREGRIRRRVGQGTFVAETLAEAALRLDAPPSPADLMEARLMVEPAVAGAAALRALDPEIDALRGMIAGEPAADWRAWEARDAAFHAAIAAAARNPLLAALIRTLEDMRRRDDWARLRARALTPERQAANIAQHAAVVEAIARRDPAGAAAAMRVHLETVETAMRDGVGPDDRGALRPSEEIPA